MVELVIGNDRVEVAHTQRNQRAHFLFDGNETGLTSDSPSNENIDQTLYQFFSWQMGCQIIRELIRQKILTIPILVEETLDQTEISKTIDLTLECMGNGVLFLLQVNRIRDRESRQALGESSEDTVARDVVLE